MSNNKLFWFRLLGVLSVALVVFILLSAVYLINHNSNQTHKNQVNILLNQDKILKSQNKVLRKQNKILRKQNTILLEISGVFK